MKLKIQSMLIVATITGVCAMAQAEECQRKVTITNPTCTCVNNKCKASGARIYTYKCEGTCAKADEKCLEASTVDVLIVSSIPFCYNDISGSPPAINYNCAQDSDCQIWGWLDTSSPVKDCECKCPPKAP